MELQNKSNSLNPEKFTKPPWFGSNTSCQSDGKENSDGCMTFQSKEPIIPMQEKKPKEKVPGGSGGHGAHGVSVEHPTSFTETLMHLFKGNVGSGVFAMGDAVKNAGIVVGPVVILFLGVVCVHCQHMLLNTAKKMKEKANIQTDPDFAETVELSFATGPKTLRKMSVLMRKLVNLFLCITQLGFCCVYFVFISTNLQQVLKFFDIEMDVHALMAIILLPILLSCLVRNLKYLAPFSTVANLFMVIGIIITLYYSTKELPSFSDRDFTADISSFPLFFGTALFAFEGIGLVLPLQNEMRKPKFFARPVGVLNIGMTVVITMYISMGTIAYLKYGDDIQGSVTLNLPDDEVLSQVVKIMISLGILLTYTLQFYIAVDITWPAVFQLLGGSNFKYPVFAELVYRSLLVLLTFVLAEAIPYLHLFISLVGAFSSTALALIFPPIIELVSKWSISELKPFVVIKDIFILLIGLVGCATGTYESIHSIVKAFQENQ